jgi:hypothetical protein
MNKSRLFSTRNNLDVESREKIVSLLNQHLADAFDLYSQTKQGHWNVKGPNFIASCLISSPRKWRTTLIPSPSGRLSWAARHGAQPVSPPRLRDCRSTHPMRRLVRSTLKPWPRVTPHLPQLTGRPSTQPVNSATPTRRTGSPKFHGDWKSRSGSWKATC